MNDENKNLNGENQGFDLASMLRELITGINGYRREIAAELAMVFATVVAWAFQRHFGNLRLHIRTPYANRTRIAGTGILNSIH